MTPDEMKKKIAELTQRTEAARTKKADYSGQLKAKKEELAALILEIKAAGYDPKTLVADRDRSKAELEQLIIDFEADLLKTETALSVYDKK